MTTIREPLLARADDTHPGLLAGDVAWTWQEYVAQAARRAHVLAGYFDPALPPHVGLLMDNTAEMAAQLASAGFGAHVAVGLNNTRRGAALLADIRKADCQVLIADPRQLSLLDGLDLSGVKVIASDDPQWLADVAAAPSTPPDSTPDDDTLFMLVFTSGTSGAPKAVRITHLKVTKPGTYLLGRLGVGREDVFYMSMPLFHSNSLLAAWAPALMCGGTMALGEKFSARGTFAEVRRYGATFMNYVGKPLAYILATPEQPDDADNPLRLAFGNEGGDRDMAEFARRFDCRVIDGFGSTENAVRVTRIEGTPPGSLGAPAEGVAIHDPETLQECPPAQFDAQGRVTNLEEATGELVNTTGGGEFAGYYNDESATSERLRHGMYWSGDLAYRDADGWVYFAGRSDDWLRVDGENIAAAPIEAILTRHPAVSEAVVFAVPDESAGDQLVATMILRQGAELTKDGFETFLDEQSDLGTKSRPRFVVLTDALPRTASNKVIKRELRAVGVPNGAWVREARGTSYR